jgi:hypothetical protein
MSPVGHGLQLLAEPPAEKLPRGQRVQALPAVPGGQLLPVHSCHRDSERELSALNAA